MGIWSRLAGVFQKDASNIDRWFVDWATGGKTSAGVAVSPDSAMRTSEIWACVRVRSEDVGKLPCIFYKRLPDGGKERATKHALYALIHDQPNPINTAFEFRQMLQAEIDLRGNGLAIKEFNARGEVVALWPINWQYVEVLITPDRRELFYRIRLPNRPQVTWPAEAVVHLRGLTLDGIVGVSPITYHRETIGAALAAQKYGSSFFGNSAQPNGALKVPNKLSTEAAVLLRESWKARHQGKNELGIFDGGMEWVQTGMNNVDAQYVESMKFNASQIWRIYRMPPHKVGDLDKATFSNIEAQGLEYVQDCLSSETTRWQQTLRRDLLTEEEKKLYFFEFLLDDLLRGDTLSRYQAYAIARNWGVLSVNDIRERENLNHVPNGDIYLQPLNMIEAGKEPPPPPPAPTAPVAPTDDPPEDPAAAPGKAKMLAALKRLIAREELRHG